HADAGDRATQLTVKGRKARRERVAAQILLQSYLDAGCPVGQTCRRLRPEPVADCPQIRCPGTGWPRSYTLGLGNLRRAAGHAPQGTTPARLLGVPRAGPRVWMTKTAGEVSPPSRSLTGPASPRRSVCAPGLMVCDSSADHPWEEPPELGGTP